jgi:hypothetical protein
MPSTSACMVMHRTLLGSLYTMDSVITLKTSHNTPYGGSRVLALSRHAPPLNPARFGEGGGENANNTPEYAEAAPAKDAEGYVLDESAAPSVVYATYVSSTEAGVGDYEVVDGTATGGDGYERPVAEYVPGNDNAAVYDQAEDEPAPAAARAAREATAAAAAGGRAPKQQCARSAPTGDMCQKNALPGGGLFCVQHACPECGAGKSSSAPGCPAHMTRPRKQSVYAGFDEGGDADTEA